ncbi:envelope stress response membrane protein PspC [Ferrimonas balearica]|uniref:envelope stress response membrane protein PspC n=1 Tax=Ferrimonas balearica TaxID=44012 RepID=UPI001C995429|nr:envelope stress response membrane protein PspC [Ferrimonas balearica]MBY5993794.1 envelope stress response membrane protein PspC [Ferrimonas balearica]
MSHKAKKELYRIPEQGKVAGVCAGIAEHFNLEVWLVRIVVLSAIILTGVFSFALLLYIVAWVLLDKKPPMRMDHRSELKTKIWQAGESPRQAIREIGTRFRSLELRLRRLEQHVTSDSYSLKREIDNLK